MRVRTTMAVWAAAALAVASLNVVSINQAQAATVITQQAVAPYSMVAGVSAAATVSVTSTTCVTLQWLTVGVRDSAGNQNDPSGNPYDFAGSSNVQVCPSGLQLTTYARSFATPGEYTIFGAYELNNQWTLLPAHGLHVGPAGTTARPSWATSGTYTAVPGGSDEFNETTGLDRTKWSLGRVQDGSDPYKLNGMSHPINGYNAITRPSYYEEDCYSDNNVAVSGGTLRLTLTNAPSTCYDGNGNLVPRTYYTGAMINSYTKFSQSGGSYEARVYIPPSAADPTVGAAWPAWWLNGLLAVGTKATAWPDHGEIDIAEGGSGGIGSHSYYVGNSTASINNPCPPGASTCSPYVGWHNFGVSWNASAMTVSFYYDGALVGTLNAGPISPTSLAKYLDFQYSVNEQSPLPTFPSTMQVDWVRVWQQP